MMASRTSVRGLGTGLHECAQLFLNNEDTWDVDIGMNRYGINEKTVKQRRIRKRFTLQWLAKIETAQYFGVFRAYSGRKSDIYRHNA
jgi:hypothetical protein